MDSIIIVSTNIEKMQHWIDVLNPLYTVSFIDKLEIIFPAKTNVNKDSILVVDTALIEDVHQFPIICDSFHKVLVVSEKFTPSQQIQLIYDGASGYSNYSIDMPLVKRTIEGIISDEVWLERRLIPTLLKGIVDKQNSSKCAGELNEKILQTLSILTNREVEVVEHVYKGEDILTISNTLHITARTVKAHLSAIFRKLDVQDRFQLVVFLKDLHVGNSTFPTSSMLEQTHIE